MRSACTEATSAPAAAAHGGLADAIGGIASIVLAIIVLNVVHLQIIMAIAVIVFGAALLIQGGMVLCEYEAGAADARGSHSATAACPLYSWSAVAGIVLGVKASVILDRVGDRGRADDDG